MTHTLLPLEQEWEIFAHYEDHFFRTALEWVGAVYAPTRRAAIKQALREFGADVGRQLTARRLND